MMCISSVYLYYICRLLRQSIQQPEKSNELIECSQRALYLRIPQISPCRISNGQSTVMFTQAVSTLDFAGAFKDGRRANYVYKVMAIHCKCLIDLVCILQWRWC